MVGRVMDGWGEARVRCLRVAGLRPVTVTPLSRNVGLFTFEPSAERVDVGLRSRGP